MPAEIIGHTFQRDALKHLLFRQKLPSTMMLAGTPGIGKRLVGLELAATLFCEKNSGLLGRTSRESIPPLNASELYGGCHTCHACHVFEAKNHPDFHSVDCSDRERWTVASVRELLYSLHLASFSGSARVVLMNDADLMSAQIANVLLKILEEPQPLTYFILIASNPSKLPPPLLSRCQIWFFDALSDEQVGQVLSQRAELSKTLSKSKLSPRDLAALAEGSLENIDSIEQHFDAWEYVGEKLDDISAGSFSTAATFGAELSKDKEKLPHLLRLMRIYSRRQMILKAQEGAPHRTLTARWALFFNNLILAQHYLFDRNLSPGPLLFSVLSALAGETKREALPESCLTNSAPLLSRYAV